MLILASESPRRRELLEKAGFKFRVIPSEREEPQPKLRPDRAAIVTAEAKAMDVARRYPDDVVLGADTIVVADGRILNKPEDERDAFLMLKTLSGGWHTVVTGVVIVKDMKPRAFFQRTAVQFFPLTDQELREYIKTGEPFDKAGAYGIQDKGSLLIKGVRGDYFNVMGLPIAKTARVLARFGIKPVWD